MRGHVNTADAIVGEIMVRVGDQRKNTLCSPVVDLKVRDVFFLF